MKIGVKITLLVIVALIALVISVILGCNGIGTINDRATDCADRHIKNSFSAAKIVDNLRQITVMNALYYCYKDNPKAIDILNDSIAKLGVEIRENLGFLKGNVYEEYVHYLVDFEQKLAISGEARQKLNNLVAADDWDGYLSYRIGEYKDLVDASIASMQVFEKNVEGYIYKFLLEESDEQTANVTFLLLLIAGISVIILIVLSIIIIMGITKPLKKAVEAAENISRGNFNVDIETNSKDETGILMKAMDSMVHSLNNMSADVNHLIQNAVNGNLKTRADANKHEGDFKGIMKGINELVEAFVEPIILTAKFLADIATGDPNIQKVTKEYKGDFNDIKNNINATHNTLFAFLGEINSLSEGAKAGNLSKRADTTKAEGAWQSMLAGLNEIVESSEQIIVEAGKTLEIMATGDLTPRIKTDYKGKFDDMKNNINNLGDSLTDLISQLQEAIHTTASASAEISSTADTLAAATQEQSSQTDEVATAMEEMSRTVTNNAHSATQTANVARQSGDVASSGGKVVEQTISKMKEIAAVVKMSADNIAKLGESSKKIGEIISVIDDIADQTNLLSLNAAIEAARAGEQGRGFAVVADSVGKLAVSTASATKEIADMIKGIQQDTDSAVKAMEKGTTEVQSGIELADNAGHSIQDILININELLGMVNQIAAASEQQSATSEQISKNVSSISKVTADSARNVEDVASTANELARMTETLTSLVSQFKIGTGISGHRSLGSNENRLLN